MPGLEIFTPEFLQIIQSVGFPVGVNIALILLIVWMIQRDQKREVKIENRYSQMVDKLFETINSTSTRHEKTITDINTELKNVTSEIAKFGIRMDRYSGIVDEELEARRKLLIFKDRGELREELDREELDKIAKKGKKSRLVEDE